MPLGHTQPAHEGTSDPEIANYGERGAPARRAHRRRWLLVALGVFVAGVAVSATAGLLLRASGQRRERQAFESTASNVTVTLGALLRRDTDFVSTIRAVLSMRPDLTPTGFDSWYRR